MNLQELKERYRDDIFTIMDRHGAENIRIFGSVARGEANEESDVDFLVHLRPKTTLLDLAAMHREVSELLSIDVDIISERGISPYMKDQILEEATPL